MYKRSNCDPNARLRQEGELPVRQDIDPVDGFQHKRKIE